MKKQFFKTAIKLGLLSAALMFGFVACDDDDDDSKVDVLVEDGYYIKGAGTALTDYDTKGMMEVTKNEVKQENRASLLELYVAVEGGAKGFNIFQVAGKTIKSFGPGTDFAIIPEANLDVEEPKNGLWKGSFIESTTPFTVPEDGLYHVMIDTELGKVAIAKVVWGLIGGATPGGWSGSTPMTATFNLNKMDFMVENVTMLKNEFKFRYSDGWKIILDADFDLGGGDKGIKVNTNFGESLTALEAGGGNIANTEYAVYKFTMTWELGVGTTVTMVKTGEAEPLPEYPENLYMIGGALNLADSDNNGTPDGWQWDLTDMKMNPVHSHANAFWKIVWLEASEGFKFAPGREWVGDFGCSDGDKDAVGDHLKGGSNIKAPATAGYYMVWVDLERDSISVTSPEVYLIGDAVGGYDAAVAANMFTVDNANSVLTITKDLAAGNLRIHAWHKWHYDWWQHEFNIIDGKIEYRGTGGDQAAVPVTAGTKTIKLNFKTGTGTIE